MENTMKVFWNKRWADDDLPEKRFSPQIVGVHPCCQDMHDMLHDSIIDDNDDWMGPRMFTAVNLDVYNDSSTRTATLNARLRVLRDTVPMNVCPTCGAKLELVQVDDFPKAG